MGTDAPAVNPAAGKALACLAGSLILMLGALLLDRPLLFGLGAVSALTSLAWIRVRSRVLLLSFWIWLNFVLLLIFFLPRESGRLWLGLPLPAFWMLFGIWIFPVLLWPLGFLLCSRRRGRS